MTEKKKKTPTLRAKKTEDCPGLKPVGAMKLRPGDKEVTVKHGLHTFAELLKGDIDGRTTIARRRSELEAEWIDHAGGLDRCTPGMLSLIKRIVHQELMLEYGEKVMLLGLYSPDQNFQARINSQRLNILALEQMIKNRGSPGSDYEDILKTITQDEDGKE